MKDKDVQDVLQKLTEMERDLVNRLDSVYAIMSNLPTDGKWVDARTEGVLSPNSFYIVRRVFGDGGKSEASVELWTETGWKETGILHGVSPGKACRDKMEVFVR